MVQERPTDSTTGEFGRTEATTTDLDLYLSNSSEAQVLAPIEEGMRVVDANGEALGKVEFVQFGDPEAVTVSRLVLQDRIGLREAFLGGAEPHVPEPYFSHLLRLGYVKIDGRGWIDSDYYVTPDMIQGTSGSVVTLKVPKDRVLTEIEPA